MKRLLILLLFAIPLRAQSVPIQNPSFEQISGGSFQPNNPCGLAARQAGVVVTGWLLSYDSVALQPNGGSNPCGTPLSPGGSLNAIELMSSTIAQDLGIKPSDLEPSYLPDGHYVAKCYIINFFSFYPGYYEVKIIFGTIDPVTHNISGHELCSVDGWATQNWTDVSFPCPSPRYLIYNNWPIGVTAPADPDAHTIISISNTNGWPVMVTGPVSLTFTSSN